MDKWRLSLKSKRYHFVQSTPGQEREKERERESELQIRDITGRFRRNRHLKRLSGNKINPTGGCGRPIRERSVLSDWAPSPPRCPRSTNGTVAF